MVAGAGRSARLCCAVALLLTVAARGDDEAEDEVDAADDDGCAQGLASKKVKELRQMVSEKGIACEGCKEKNDLIEALCDPDAPLVKKGFGVKGRPKPTEKKRKKKKKAKKDARQAQDNKKADDAPHAKKERSPPAATKPSSGIGIIPHSVANCAIACIVLYRGYKGFKAMPGGPAPEKKGEDDEFWVLPEKDGGDAAKAALVFWVVFAAAYWAELWVSCLLWWFPFYLELKVAGFAFLACFGGAELAYSKHLRGSVAKHQDFIDEALTKDGFMAIMKRLNSTGGGRSSAKGKKGGMEKAKASKKQKK